MLILYSHRWKEMELFSFVFIFIQEADIICEGIN